MDTETAGREKRPTFLKGLLFLLVLVLVGAGLAGAALTLRSDEGPKVAVAEPAPIAVSVTALAIQEAFEIDETFSGLAAARRESMLGFTTGGRIAALYADVGDAVRAGARLARLDVRDLNARLDAAEARVREAKASHDLARATVERQRTLKARGHVSQQVVDEAVAQADTALARIAAAEADAATLRVQIDLASITAPFAGVVTERLADEGAIAAPGSPVFRLVETGAVEARIGVPAALAETLAVGETHALLHEGRRVEATLRAKTGVIGAANRTVTILFDLPEDAGVPPGAVVRLSLQRTFEEPGAWVPVTALTEARRGLWSVLVAHRENGHWLAEPRLVEIVHSDGDRVFIRGPLEPGEQLITEGLQRITPGQKVTPRRPGRTVSGVGGR